MNYKQKMNNQKNIKRKQALKMAKRGEQVEKKIEGVEYIFQHPGILESIRIRDRSKNENGKIVEEALCKELMEHVIFLKEGGKTDFDYFEEHDGFKEVIAEASKYAFR